MRRRYFDEEAVDPAAGDGPKESRPNDYDETDPFIDNISAEELSVYGDDGNGEIDVSDVSFHLFGELMLLLPSFFLS